MPPSQQPISSRRQLPPSCRGNRQVSSTALSCRYRKCREKIGQSPTETTANESQQRIARAKKTNVVDIFHPAEPDTLSIPDRRESVNGTPTVMPSTADQATQRKRNRARNDFSSTSRLKRFIDCWPQFDTDQFAGVRSKAKEDRPGYKIEITSINNPALKPVAKKPTTTVHSHTYSAP